VSLPARSIRNIRKPPAVALSSLTPNGLPGFPQGAITEITGPHSSGRSTLLHASLASATAAGELCAIIDGANSFDPHSAAAAGVKLERLLWVQCHHDVTDTIRATDLIVHAGGFRLVALDLCDLALDRVPPAWWHRLRLAVDNTPNVLLVTSSTPALRQAAALQVELAPSTAHWPGTLLAGVDIAPRQRKPVQPAATPPVLRIKAV